VAPHFIAEDFVAFVGKDSRSIQLLDAKFVIILPMKNVKSLVSVTAKNVLLIPLTYRSD